MKEERKGVYEKNTVATLTLSPASANHGTQQPHRRQHARREMIPTRIVAANTSDAASTSHSATATRITGMSLVDGAVTLRIAPPSNGNTHWHHAQHRRHYCRRSKQTIFSAASSAKPAAASATVSSATAGHTPGLRSAARSPRARCSKRAREPRCCRRRRFSSPSDTMGGHTRAANRRRRRGRCRAQRKGEESIERLGSRRNKN